MGSVYSPSPFLKCPFTLLSRCYLLWGLEVVLMAVWLSMLLRILRLVWIGNSCIEILYLLYHFPHLLPNLLQWISKHARIALMGDSAHPFLPTSVQGASQAIEDGVTIATVLKLAHDSSGNAPEIPIAMLAYEHIRYDHVCKAQETGKSIREMWHKTDLYAEEFHPENIKMPFRPWIFENDAERVAVERYPAVSRMITEGRLVRQGVQKVDGIGSSGETAELTLAPGVATSP